MPNTPGNMDNEEGTDTDMGGSCTRVVCGAPKERLEIYDWEQKVLDETVMKNGVVDYAAIVSFSDGELRGAAPRDFDPEKEVLVNVVNALKGDTSGLLDTSLDFGSGSRKSTPGKIDSGRAIYGSDGQGGGCCIFKSKECVLIVIYENDVTQATRLASEVAEYMEEQGH